MAEGSNARFTKLARRLRAKQTDADRKLWQAIRSSQLYGAKVRRQVHIAPYIVDFCFEGVRLIVEVDGSQHMENVDEDEKRSEFLRRRGYEVIRFDNIEVLTNLDGVFEIIGHEIQRRM